MERKAKEHKGTMLRFVPEEVKPKILPSEYDNDLKWFAESEEKSVRVYPLGEVKLDSLRSTLKNRIKKLGLGEKVKVVGRTEKTGKGKARKVVELYLTKTEEKA